MLVGDVLRVAMAPLRHGSLVLLGDEEAALPPSVVGTVHVRDETRRRGDALRLLAREDVPEIHLGPGPLQAPRRRVVRAGSLMRRLEGAEAEPDVAGPYLGGVPAVGALADAAKAPSTPAARRYGGAVVA